MTQATCQARTQEGDACKNPPHEGSIYCHIHQELEQQCQALTQKGTPCQNAPQEGSPYCHVHRNQCQAITEDGEACSNYANEESDYCYIHRHLEEDATPVSFAKMDALLGEVDDLLETLDKKLEGS